MTAPAAVRAARVEARVLRDRLRPPPDLTVSAWADAYRVLSREASAEPGRWSTARAPYQRGIMDAFSEPGIDTVVVMSAAQVGKTDIFLNVIGYHIDQDPAPILVLQPTLDMGHAFSKDRLAPMLRDTPRLSHRVAPVKSRDSGNTLLHKTFLGGHVTIAGANSAASLASRPIRVFLGDEVDRWPRSAGSEGDPWNLGAKRTATFWNRKLGAFSTPTVKGESRIEEAYEEGDQRRYWVPCPDCGEFQALKWANVHWEHGDPSTARYGCEHCGSLLDEAQKLPMLLGGEWRAEFPGRPVASFHLSALYSPWRTWEEVVREFLASKGNPERLRVWVNTDLGETWEEEGDRVEPDALLLRREKYPADVPAGAAVLTAGVDVQGDRLEAVVKGWGRGEESWLIDQVQLWGDPGQPDVWRSLEETLFNQTFAHEHGATLRVACTCVDSGGHHTEAVYRWVRQHRSRRVYAVKGVGGEGRPLVGRPSKANKWGVKLIPVGTDTAKDAIFARLRILPAESPEGPEPTPGLMHFPDWADPEYFAQLTAEKVVTRYHMGRQRRTYEKTRPRNEALDLEVYAMAALIILGPGTVNNLGNLVDELAGHDPAPDGDAAPRRPARKAPGRGRGRGFVGRW